MCVCVHSTPSLPSVCCVCAPVSSVVVVGAVINIECLSLHCGWPTACLVASSWCVHAQACKNNGHLPHTPLPVAFDLATTQNSCIKPTRHGAAYVSSVRQPHTQTSVITAQSYMHSRGVHVDTLGCVLHICTQRTVACR